MGARILISIATVRKWPLSQVDVKSAFLQTSAAVPRVYVIPPRESECRFQYFWLLLIAQYGLLNDNAKFKVQSDDLLLDLGLLQVIDVLQLFYGMIEGQLAVFVAKILDDILIAGETNAIDQHQQAFNIKVKFGAVIQRPVKLHEFGFNIVLHDGFTCRIDGDNKLTALELPLLTPP